MVFWYMWIVFVLLVCVKPLMCLNFEAYFRMLAFFHDSWPLCIMQICSEMSVLNYFWYVWIVSVLLVCINPLMGLNFEAYFRMLAFFHDSWPLCIMQICREMSILNGFWYMWIVSVLLVCINLFYVFKLWSLF